MRFGSLPSNSSRAQWRSSCRFLACGSLSDVGDELDVIFPVHPRSIGVLRYEAAIDRILCRATG